MRTTHTSSGGDPRRFARDRLTATGLSGHIGGGAIGAKCSGLVDAERVIGSIAVEPTDLELFIPPWVVLGTDVFQQFLRQNGLHDIEGAGLSDEQITATFQEAELPYEVIVGLWDVVGQLRSPLAIRPSPTGPRGGDPFRDRVPATKFIPNNRPDRDDRLQSLLEAVKLVYASPFLSGGRARSTSTRVDRSEPAMAVIVQEVVGVAHGSRYYPDFTGRCISPAAAARANSCSGMGRVELVVGLGKTLVEGRCGYSVLLNEPESSPGRSSSVRPPGRRQREFWAVNIGEDTCYDPFSEGEYLVKTGLQTAKYDGVSRHPETTDSPVAHAPLPGARDIGRSITDSAPFPLEVLLSLEKALEQLLVSFRARPEAGIAIDFAALVSDREASKPSRLGILGVHGE